MQVGRFITRRLISLLQKDEDHRRDIEGLEGAMESIVEMSCLLHDVGNPPFGHFGERAIQDWLTANLDDCILSAFADSEETEKAQASEYVPAHLIKDIIGFEGNAQGIRIITTLQKLNLTKTQIASVLKYTRCGTEDRPEDKQHPQYYMLKKVGYFFSEKALIDDVTSFHGLEKGHRHPMAYIMEAADDISYCIADLEDAVDKNLLTMNSLRELLISEYTKLKPECDKMKKILESNQSWSQYDASDVSQFFIAFRSSFVVALVKYAAEVICDNLSAILDGSYSGHILEDDSSESCMAKAMKRVAFGNVFNHPEVEANELKGYTVISGLLEKYKPLMEAPEHIFNAALENSHDVPVLLSRLCKKLPAKHLRAYKDALDPDTPSAQLFPNRKVLEYYSRCRLIQDLISGMTDQYALDEYRELMALA
jgi:dGTPase